MPILLPGLLELTRRARYFSFHAFLLAEYERRQLPADRKAQAEFIRSREWDFGLAVQRCGNCDSSPVGAQRLTPVSRGAGPFPRGESVESTLGGYGLYDRSPMAELGIVARFGTARRSAHPDRRPLPHAPRPPARRRIPRRCQGHRVLPGSDVDSPRDGCRRCRRVRGSCVSLPPT
jgi:hypothetical protein